jgi:hypothetical protein
LAEYDIGIWFPFTIKRLGSTSFIRELWFASRHIFKSRSFYITDDKRLNSILQPLRITKTENVTHFKVSFQQFTEPIEITKRTTRYKPGFKILTRKRRGGGHFPVMKVSM